MYIASIRLCEGRSGYVHIVIFELKSTEGAILIIDKIIMNKDDDPHNLKDKVS